MKIHGLDHVCLDVTHKNPEETISKFIDKIIAVASGEEARNEYNGYREISIFRGFENFKTEKIISKGDKLEDYSINNSTTIPLISNNDVYYTLNIGNGENLSNINLSLNYDKKNLNKISIKQGDKLFTASVLVNNQKISNIDLLSGEDVKYTPSTIIKNILHSNNYFIIGIILFVILIIIIFIIISLLRHKKRRKNFLSKRSYIRNKHNF